MTLLGRKWALSRTIAGLCATAIFAVATSAYALILVNDTPTLAVSNPVAGQTSSYTFGTYQSEGAERPQSFSVTFPPGTNVSGATAADPAGSVQITGRTVTVTFDSPLPGSHEFTVAIGGIVNPGAGTYSFPDAVIHTRNPGGRQPIDHPVPVSDVTIMAGALDMSLSTNLVEFVLAPEVPAPAQTVSLTVASSSGYTITREVSGEADQFGLSVTGQAAGAKPAGSSTFADTYEASVPWTTEGDRTYTATVTYSVVQ